VRKGWELGLFSLEKRRPQGDLKSSLPVSEGACRKAGEGLLTRAWSDRTRGDGFKLKEGRFRLDMRKKFFPMRVVRPWPRLPREAVAVPSLAGFRSRLEGALSNLGWWKVSLPMAGSWNQMVFKGLFQPKPFYDKIGFVLLAHFQGKIVINQALTEQCEKEAHLLAKPSLWVCGLAWT